MSDNKGSMMRVSSGLLEDIKMLKKIKSKGGKLGNSGDLVHTLVRNELRKTHADTAEGFLPEGAVVLGPSTKPVIIKSVTYSAVVFSDDTFVVNGGTACYAMALLAETVREYDGGLFDV